MIYTRRRYECPTCGASVTQLAWNTDPAPACHGAMVETDIRGVQAPAVHDDQLEGGARWCETMADQPVWLDGTKSQWRRLCEQHQVRNVVRHDEGYYRRARQQHDEQLRDTRKDRESAGYAER